MFSILPVFSLRTPNEYKKANDRIREQCTKALFQRSITIPTQESKVAMQDDLIILVVHRDFTGRPIQIFLLLRFMLPLKHSPVATLYSS